MQRTIFLCSLFFLLSSSLVAQKGAMKKADKTFALGEYNLAIDQYKKAAQSNGYAAVANFKIGESYRMSNRIHLAEPYYAKAIEAGTQNPLAWFYNAFALKSNEKYDEASQSLETFLEKADPEEYAQYITWADEEIGNLKVIKDIAASDSYYEISNLKAVNTPNAEYAPFFKNGKFYFTSNRLASKTYKATGTGFTDIYTANEKNGQIDVSSIRPMPSFMNDDNINEGCIAISPDGRTLVFAKGNTGKKKGADDVNLFVSYYRNKDWSDPEKMSINFRNAWNSTPAFGRNSRTLYFSSTGAKDSEGHIGKTDIYVANRDANGRWGNTKNLGSEINTPGDDMFPYVSENGNLYFASTGHPGFGELDLFRAEKEDGKISIINLGQPINSNRDDFALTYSGHLNGYFCSNRPSGEGDDDIYTFVNNDPSYKIVNYLLTGLAVTIDGKGKQKALPLTRIKLLDGEGNLLERVTTDENAAFKFRVDEDMMYVLVGEKAGYFTAREPYATLGKGLNKEDLIEFETTVVFDTVLVLVPIVLDQAIVLENIYYDLDKADIRPDAAIELDKLVAILNDNPYIKIELSSHTDTRADDAYNLDLSQRRAESAVHYIISRGIAEDRVTARGYGESQLILPDEHIDALPTEAAKEAAHQRNRRTEFKVTQYDKNQVLENEQAATEAEENNVEETGDEGE